MVGNRHFMDKEVTAGLLNAIETKPGRKSSKLSVVLLPLFHYFIIVCKYHSVYFIFKINFRYQKTGIVVHYLVNNNPSFKARCSQLPVGCVEYIVDIIPCNGNVRV